MKRFSCTLMAAVMLLSFCGCKNAKSNDTTSNESAEVIVEEIVMHTSNDKTTNEEQTSSEEKTTVSEEDLTSTSKPISQDQQTSVQKPTSSKTSTSDKTPVSSKEPTSSKTPVSSRVETTSSEVTLPQDDGVYMLNDQEVLKKIKLNGRCDKSTDGIGLGMVASAIEFNTNSTAVMIEANCAADIYYTVVVDGEVTQKRAVTTSGKNYIFIRDLSTGNHNIKVIRDCEGRTDKYFTVVSLQLDDGELLAKDNDKPVIEFLGDSITSGYGNIVLDGVSEPQDLKNQSSMKSYAYLIAEQIGFDYRIISQSGIALAKREGYFSFPDYYNTENYHLGKEKKYTSSSPNDVDIVVVNLGTNDIGSKMYDTKNQEQVNAYVKLYADLITTIGYRKDAKIVFVSDIWYHDPAIADGGVVNELKSRGYNNVYSYSFKKQYRAGGGGHPSQSEQQEMANTLIKFLKDNKIV